MTATAIRKIAIQSRLNKAENPMRREVKPPTMSNNRNDIGRGWPQPAISLF
jgi:hypothetical protein